MTTLHPNTFLLPDELFFEIFSRLPTKVIARCGCVCKLWVSMLRRQDFIDSFLAKSCARPQIIFVCRDHQNKVFFSSAPQPQNLQGNSYVLAANHLAPFPTSCVAFGYTNGFFLNYYERWLEEQRDLVTVAVIGNPSTGQCLTLPRLKSGMGNGRTTFVLGYDPIAKEFKVLSMTSHIENSVCISMEYQVLTLGTQIFSWRKVQCCIPHMPSHNSICISGVLYYIGEQANSMVVCFDLRTEKFNGVSFSGSSNNSKPSLQTLVNYNGKLGMLMSEDSICVGRGSKSIDLWVLQDAAKHEWSKHVYMLPLLWKDVVAEGMQIVGMIGSKEIVLSPWKRDVQPYVIYYNVESKTITKVGVHGIQDKYLNTYLNYVENVKLL